MKKVLKILTIIIISLICSIKNIKADELPKVYFEGNINDMTSKEDERKIKLTYTSKELNFDAYALIKIQGSSSLTYEKKNYTIKLYKDRDYDNKKRINVGFGDEYKYCLKANWVDKTHARNIVTAKIASDIQQKYNLFTNTPNNGLINGFPVEIYVNNTFYGLYTWNIPKDEWLFNMNKNNPNHIAIVGDSYTYSTLFQEKATLNNGWEIEIGPQTNETLDKFNRVIEFISTSTDKEFKQNFEKYLNLDATLNYYIMLNIAELFDNNAKNLFMITYDGNIWSPSLYDLDTSWGVQYDGKSFFNYDTTLIEKADKNLLWIKFEKNFNNEIANRYFELRKNILTKENILNEFNNFTNQIPTSSIEKEHNKWQNIPGYDINQIEEFLNTRIPRIDDYMYNLYDINSTITMKYSTVKPTLKPVEITLKPNRNDTIILINGKQTYNYNYTFKENGEYILEYQDWKGNSLGTVTMKVNWIIKNKIIYILITTILILTGILLSKQQQKKKELLNSKTTTTTTATTKTKIDNKTTTPKNTKTNKKANKKANKKTKNK